MTGTGLGSFGNSYTRGKLTVFCYHDVSDNPSEFSHKYQLDVCPSLFEWQLSFLKNHFNFVSPDDLLRGRLPPKSALITFDDGFRSFFINAVPILENHRVPCIIFLNMGPVKGEIFWSGLITYLCEKRPDFVQYLKSQIALTDPHLPLFLSCSKEIVNSYIQKVGVNFGKQVSEFVGPLAKEEDLQEASQKNLIFYGNHLFNHNVPLLMSDDELVESFVKNIKELEKYPNYRNMFSFPFGQPGSCFSRRQVDLLINAGAKKVFRSSGGINVDAYALYLDRIALTSWHNSSDRMFFQIFRHRLKGLYDRFFQFPFKL